MNIAFKCKKCNSFYGVPDLDHTSYITFYDYLTDSITTFDLCHPCLDATLKLILTSLQPNIPSEVPLLEASDKQETEKAIPEEVNTAPIEGTVPEEVTTKE